jgi:hypothetical protein
MENRRIMFIIEQQELRSEGNFEQRKALRVTVNQRQLQGISEARAAKTELEEALTALVAAYRSCVSVHVVEVTGEEIDGRITVTVGL